jgi:hypothetical protein
MGILLRSVKYHAEPVFGDLRHRQFEDIPMGLSENGYISEMATSMAKMMILHSILRYAYSLMFICSYGP